jgi:hypothetical protein
MDLARNGFPFDRCQRREVRPNLYKNILDHIPGGFSLGSGFPNPTYPLGHEKMMVRKDTLSLLCSSLIWMDGGGGMTNLYSDSFFFLFISSAQMKNDYATHHFSNGIFRNRVAIQATVSLESPSPHVKGVPGFRSVMRASHVL